MITDPPVSDLGGKRLAFAVYKPRPGREGAFLALLTRHVPLLRAKGLTTNRSPTVVQAADGSIVEIFEWVSEAAANQAHDLPEVMDLWERMEMVAVFATLSSLAEAGRPFPHFMPLSLGACGASLRS